MTYQEFKTSTIEWGQLLQPTISIEKQEAIVKSEQEEFADAYSPDGKALEASDCIWTLLYLAYLYEKKGEYTKAREAEETADSYRIYTNSKALTACSLSNWTKIKKGDKAGVFSSLQKEMQALDSRYQNPKIKLHEKKGVAYGWIIADDHKGKEVQYGKVVKLKGYTSKEVLYS